MHNLLLPVVVKYKDEWVRDAFLKLDVVAKQKEYIKKYGSPYVKEFFTVHLTLAGPDVDSVKFESFTKQKSIMNPVIITVDEICLMVKINNEWKIDMRLPLK